jgi:5'-nucleotidase / UDP-sugar diphosphatase
MYRPYSKLVLTILVAALVGAAILTPARAELVNLTILHTNDTRGRISPYMGKTGKPAGGYAKRAIFFQEKRRHEKISWLTLDAGNAFGYSPLSFYLKGYLDTKLMSMAGYDASGIGPMEFMSGRKELAARVGEAAFPFLSANVKDKATGKYVGEPFKVVESNGFRIGILGLTDTTTPMQFPPASTEGLEFSEPLEVAAQWIPQLKSQCDTIVLLSTLTLTENIALAIAHPEISVIVAGGHEAELQVPLKVDSTLIVEAGRYGAKVGMLKMTYEGERGKGYKIRYFDEQLVEIGGAWAENSLYKQEISANQPRLSEQLDIVVGSLAKDMPATKVNSFETQIGNMFADAIRTASSTDVAIVEAGAIRYGMKKGPVTRGDILRVFPGESRIITGNMSGADLTALLSQGASNVGRDGFLQVSGVSFGIYNGKAYSVTVGGTPVSPDAMYKVAMTERVSDGIEGLTSAYLLKDAALYPHLVREAVEDYLTAHAEFTSELEERISYFAEPPSEEVAAPPASAEAEEQPNPEAVEEAPPADEAVTDEGATREGEVAEAPSDEAVAEETATEAPAAEASPTEEAAAVEEAPGEYEVLTEETVDPGLAPTTEAPPAEEAAPVETEATTPAADADDKAIVGTGAVDLEDVHYEFNVMNKDVHGEGLVEMVVTVRNNSDANKVLSFPSGKHYDFKVFKENALLWNYGYNRYYTQETGSITLAPGEETVFRCYWDGMTNNKTGLTENLYRFVAEVSTTPQMEVSFIALFAPPQS